MAKRMRVIWAIDPYAKLEKVWRSSSDVARILAKKRKAEILPTFVLGAETLNWVNELGPAETDRFLPEVQEKLAKVVESTGLKNKALEPKVIVNRQYSRRADIRALLKYAKDKQADLIIVNTHAQKGLERFFMGSFAETLLFHSKVPILFLNPQAKVKNNFKKALFPTDFSDGSKKSLRGLLSICKRICAKILIYNRIPYPIEAFQGAGLSVSGGGWIHIDRFIERDQLERQRLAKSWGKQVRAAGFGAETRVLKGDDRISEDILRVAKKTDADLIVMGTEVGVLSQLFLGSMARNVIRAATIPVLVNRY